MEPPFYYYGHNFSTGSEPDRAKNTTNCRETGCPQCLSAPLPSPVISFSITHCLLTPLSAA